ncbi:MAG TPA: T9SS type A sorting domain-containing protein [Cytophagales bacterium]|nr:T9SS type A sorting domain-containing protein [Cytophagales bacterium]
MDRGKIILCVFLILGLYQLKAQKAVVKTNDLKVYMHYMPWFETPETIGQWGWHWKMNNKNPNKIDPATGEREIASHYYPLIGPYASRDKDVIEYHLLLMKLSGIDGVLINWYGVQGSNGDINDLLKSSDSIVSSVDDFGMQFGVIMEDRFSRSIDDVKANMTYLKNNYFNKPEYIRHGEDQNPLVGIFGPITFSKPENWAEIMPSAGEELEFLTLWYESGEAGTYGDGEYSWVYQDGSNHINHLQNFYTNKASQLKTVMGSAYPGFNDFYKQGAAGAGYFYIPHNMGATLDQTLAKATEHKSKMDMLQLVTWNDFGEGTMFEPTKETGFDYLKKVQKFTGVQYGEEELKLVYKLYKLRKQHKEDGAIQQQLNLASDHLNNLLLTEAKAILDNYEVEEEEPTGFLDNELTRSPLQIYPNPAKENQVRLELGKIMKSPNTLSLIDISGKELIRKDYPAGISNINLSLENIKNGIYLIHVRSSTYYAIQRFNLLRN